MNLTHARVRDGIRLRGDLTVLIHRADGSFLRRMAVRNTITYDGLNSPLFLWAQDGIVVTDYRIVQLQAGTSSTPPTRGDVGLGAPFVGNSIALGAPNRSIATATGELIITAQFDGTMANGHTLTEAGLFLGNGQLFARQVHPAIPKTGAIIVSYSWRIAITS